MDADKADPCIDEFLNYCDALGRIQVGLLSRSVGVKHNGLSAIKQGWVGGPTLFKHKGFNSFVLFDEMLEEQYAPAVVVVSDPIHLRYFTRNEHDSIGPC